MSGKYATVDYSVIMSALKAVKLNNRSIRQTSQTFGIPNSSLARYVKKFDEQGKDATS